MRKELTKRSLYLFPLFMFLIGATSGFFGQEFFSSEDAPKENGSKQIRASGFKFISPLLECEVAKGSIDALKQNFHPELSDFINRLIERKIVSSASVYFRDLNNGPTIGVREGEKFLPASLLKVPVMVTLYKTAETNPEILKKKILYKGPLSLGESVQLIKPEVELEVGKEYTIDELIYHSIVYSNNDAVSLLINEIDDDTLEKTYSLLGVESPGSRNSSPDPYLTTKNYAAFFRILYNSSFLNYEMSEKALELLSKSDYKNGLVRGVPEDILVAHKFGESGFAGEHQLHDCGIVYYPNHPYLLCVMTRGKTTVELESSIRDISNFVYEKIKAQY